jgi:putative N6-adenine-specific DNA methylase
MISFFATVAAGSEDLLAQELRALGVKGLRAGKGGVRFTGEWDMALRTCLWLRTAMRVLLPIGTVPAHTADELYQGVRSLPWLDHLDVRHTFSVEASGTSEALRHTHFTALRIKDAIVDTIREKRGARPDVDAQKPDVRIIAHLAREHCDLSLDVSGEPLFKRGYRLEPTKASLKETLAAAVLLASGYDGERPLVDPMCGSGTIALEAALIAHHRAPGLERGFGIERWPLFDDRLRTTLKELREEARAQIRKIAPPILARDRDPDAVAATRTNISRLALPVQVAEADARELTPLDPPGFVVCNPPYGERLEMGGKKNLKTFFWQLGQSWRELHGHHLSVLSGGPEFESAFGLRPAGVRAMYNGPIACRLLQYDVK